ncbi:N-acetyl-L,L-diaminopimelate deacetylase [Halarchaeum acidiphilum MH1-52-1]|uniref:Peptidase M20 domain-containing protein 2 n=1 Tax=Halarchaeum acidiphilum MH1-52-1 TaxID=1261545 RepID=U2YQW3_9EURY|nr:amidohydrolase [Halarchaeum acidiphilum]GAD51345.1 N-acetyl-L,L-diaminopimelate deacetylase [Halarchaeum acidiphilum MH1-52-1]
MTSELDDTETAALKDAACAAIDERADDLVAFASDVQAEPELGYKETATTRKVAEAFEDLGLDVETEIAVTGARARVGDGEFVAAVLGELDALVNAAHPLADPETGAVHACGHHAQLTNLLGAAYAFAETDVLDGLDAAVELIGVPAEEYLDLEYRRTLVDAGDIEFFGGKQELIKRGYFADVDCAAMIHADGDTPARSVRTRGTTNGFLGKTVAYEGVASHAGAAPEDGVNALNAANIGLNAVNAQRETFADEDHVRVHPIITKGGGGVNVVPADVRAESYVRAASVDAVLDANEDVNRALESGAMAVGGGIEIEDYPGYLPLETSATLANAYEDGVRRVLGEEALDATPHHTTGSTDMGDVTQVVAGIHPHTGGWEGALHADDFAAVDEEMAYVAPAKVTACALIDVLADSDARARVRAANEDKRGREEYLRAVRAMRETTTADYFA